MPPPVHGAAMVGQWIHDSKILNEEFETYYINPSVSNKISEVGKVNIIKILFFFKLLAKIIRTIIKIKPILCYYTPTSDGLGIYRDALTISMMRLLGRKIIIHLHNKGVKEYSKKKLADIAYKIIFHNVKVILIAEELYSDIKMYVSKDNIYILPNGIPQTITTDQYEKIISQRESNSESIRLLYLSNMMKEKGILVLLDACEMLKNLNISFTCNYVGNWGDITLDGFKEEIYKRNLQEYIIISGPQYGSDKNKHLINSDIFIFPTYYHGETFGLVLLEAMEYGLPCISTYEGGIPSIINNGENGLLVKQKDAKELFNAIYKLINDKSKRCSMGNKGRYIYMKKFRLNIFENNLSQILKSILK